MLEGFDTDWVGAGDRRAAYHASIPEPLFHQTAAFRMLPAIGLVLLGLAVAVFRIRQLRRRVSEARFEIPSGESVQITRSVGFVCYPRFDPKTADQSQDES